jgi:hypothetical protein
MADFSPLFPPLPFLLSLPKINRLSSMAENLEKVVYVKTRISSTRCLLVKLAINVQFYLSVSRFETGYSLTILLPSSYHIRIGSGFPTMQLVELALYSNGAHFLRYSLLEHLSLSLTASAISPHLMGLMCALFSISMYRCNSKITFDAFCTRVNRAWIHTKLSW